ncbi:MAG TPA: ATP-binding protein, partial [Acidimicrobiia bacterium]|nr:ATP-binding protein [Acidimicrobiia bacterium]
ALLALPDQSLVLSVSHRLSASEVEDRIRGRVDHESAPGWAAYVRRTATRLGGGDGVFERLWILAVRLPEAGVVGGLVDRLGAAASQVASRFGGPHAPPARSRITGAISQARGLEEELTQHLWVRPLKPVEVRWVFERAVLRGLADPPHPGRDTGSGSVPVVRLDRDTVYQEGGRTDDPARPRHRRYLRVDHPDHGVGFQTFACLAETPASWTFPYGTGEWLWHLDDQLPFPVDWGLRVERVDNETARRRALKAKRNLVGQLEEPGGDPAGPATSLASAADAIDEHRSRLEANPALPAFRATTIIALGHRHLDVLDHRARLLESTFRAAEHNFYRPTGAQLACYTAMLPGSPPPPIVAEYAQDLLPEGLASAMPFAGSTVGDPYGMLLGHSLDVRYPQPVFLDPAHPPRDLNRSASVAAVGELGAGKSFLAKTLTINTLGMGGQVVAVDRTEAGEYARLAEVVAGSTQVVEVSNQAAVGLDPFQVFTSDELRLRYGVGFITLLTATPPASTAGAQCHRAARAALDDAHETGRPPRLADVFIHLDNTGEGSEVADRLKALSDVSYANLIFDEHPVLDLTADYICFHTPGLRLPRRHTSRDDQLPEELVGQALLYLLAAFSRRVLFQHQDRFAALLLDEAHALTANPQGRSLVSDLIRDGRKHYAAVWAFSQLPGDLTGDTDEESLDALLGYRMVFRQARQTAPAALAFLGSDDREANLETVTSLDTGECLLRDPTGRLGLVRINPPDDPATLAVLSTTPLNEPEPAGRWDSLNSHTTTPSSILRVVDGEGVR